VTDGGLTGDPVSVCRSCGAGLPEPFLNLGRTPVANRLLRSADEQAPCYPLMVAFCDTCALVQLAWALPAEAIFDADYPYFSSFSDALVAHAHAHVDFLLDERRLSAGSFVVEVASNDGYLLDRVVQKGVRALGVEPTDGPAAAARERGVPTRQAFFGRDLAAELAHKHGRADVVVANNVMAHVPGLNDFVAGLATLVAPDGVITVENPSVVELVEHREFDTVYHEHYCYFSCTSVQVLMRRHGLTLFRVEEFADLHGGTLRWWMAPTANSPAIEQSVRDQLERERSLGVDRPDYYASFGADVAGVQNRLRSLLASLKAQGRSVAAYGAAAKGATLLNSTGIDSSTLDFVVDRNTAKQGRWIPGACLPILPVEALLERRPDDVLLLAWNFATEIVRQQDAYRSAGGRFVVPVPEPRVLS